MKMKLNLLLILVLLNNITVAQDRSLFQGKWKIISVAEGGIYYNFTTDSIFIPSKVLQEVYEEGHDSLFAVELFKEMLGSLRNYQFSFDKDSVCLESGFEKSKGIYQISNSKDSIDLVIPMSSGTPPQHLRCGYTIRSNVLNLSIPKDNYYLRLILERQ